MKIHIWISGRHKEHLYTFELLPKRDPLRFSSYSQGSITTCSSHTPLNLILIHHHSSELHTFLCSPQKHEFFDPSDWAHFHRVAPQHTRHAPLQISSKSNAIRRSYTRLRLKEHLYTFESAKFQISLIFTGQHRGTPLMPAHQVPSKSNAVRPSYSRFIRWKGECTPLATEKGDDVCEWPFHIWK